MPSGKAVIRPDANPRVDSNYLGCGVDVNRSDLPTAADSSTDLPSRQQHDDILTHPDGNNPFDTEYLTEPRQYGSCGRQPVGSSRRRR